MVEALPILCAESAEQAGEPLAGTAAHARWWVLLEERGPWARDAVESPGLDPFRDRLAAWLAAPAVRLQLIRHPRETSGPRRLFVADAQTGRIGGWVLDDPTTFFTSAAPFDALARAASLPQGGTYVEGPLFFVCTHGRRDRCCALRGMALYRALTEVEGPGDVWQTTHLGGHRFAATLVTFPHGYCLGRVAPDEAAQVRASAGLHDLSRVRGRVSYDEPTQAADLALRERLARLEPDAVHVLGSETLDQGVRVTLAAGEQRYLADVSKQAISGQRPKSCGDAPSAIASYTVERLTESKGHA